MNVLRFITPKSGVAYIDTESTIRQGIEKMLYHGYQAIPVVTRDGKYAGTVTEGDFLRRMVELGCSDVGCLEHEYIKDIIRTGWNPPVSVNATAHELFLHVTEQNFVPVVDDRGVFVGIVTRNRVMKYYLDRFSESAE